MQESDRHLLRAWTGGLVYESYSLAFCLHEGFSYTVFHCEKVQRQTTGTFSGVQGLLSGLNGLGYEGYEIHMGQSASAMPPLAGSGSVYGSYIHGVFDAPEVADTILRAVCRQKGLDFSALETYDAFEYKERQYDLLADAVRQGLDMELIYRILNREV